jgi:hypothetical protein
MIIGIVCAKIMYGNIHKVLSLNCAGEIEGGDNTLIIRERESPPYKLFVALLLTWLNSGGWGFKWA